MVIKCLSALIGLLFVLTVQAKDYGTLGHTFVIIEADLLEIIKQKLQALQQNGLLSHQQLIREKTLQAIQRPKPVVGLVKTKTPRVFEYDPTLLVQSPVLDHQGRVLVKAGTALNPLAYFQLSEQWIFIDGDDPTQVKWSLEQSAKRILVKGSPLELSKETKERFYFDQSGLLTKKLGITQIPARVFQHNRVLKIEEILLDGSV